MNTQYQARCISRQRLDAVRRSGAVTQGIVLDSFNGFLIVEPVGSNLGDGAVLAPQDADYELSPVWCSGPKGRLNEARRLLGLPEAKPVGLAMEVA
jgi:hypothetical protein